MNLVKMIEDHKDLQKQCNDHHVKLAEEVRKIFDDKALQFLEIATSSYKGRFFGMDGGNLIHSVWIEPTELPSTVFMHQESNWYGIKTWDWGSIVLQLPEEALSFKWKCYVQKSRWVGYGQKETNPKSGLYFRLEIASPYGNIQIFIN